MLQRYPYKLYTQHGGAVFMVSDRSMGGVTVWRSSINNSIYFAFNKHGYQHFNHFKHMRLTSWKHRTSTNSSLGWILVR